MEEVKAAEVVVQPVQKKMSRNAKIIVGSLAALVVAAGGFVVWKIKSKTTTAEA